MRVFVISLRGESQRRARARAQLDAAGIAFEFFDGLTGDAAIGRGTFERIDSREFLLNTGRREAAGEIGCFASHRELWKAAARLGEPIMIMEDDFALDARFPEAVAYASDVIGSVGFLRLQQSSRARRRKIASRGAFDLSIYIKPPHCTMCYCISPGVARRFIARTRVFDAPVDVFVKRYWDHGQPLFAITPYPVSASPLSAESTIAGRIRERKMPVVALRRFLRKCRWFVMRLIFNAQSRIALRTKTSIAPPKRLRSQSM